MLIRLALAFSLLTACAPAPPATPEPVRLALQWRVGGLANPESVALSSDGRFLYVSNVNGEADAKDGNGFIARVSRDGELVEREWASGLNAPKGVALHDGALYVADIDELVVLDATSGAVLRRTTLPGARFLNDVAVTRDGLALIADSDGARIYGVTGASAEIWLEHPLLDSVNGLLIEPDRIIATTMAGRLLAIDPASRAITILAEGLGDADGVAPLDGGRYLVSEWPGLLHVVSPGGAHETVIDSREEGRFLNDFLRVDDMLYQPHWEPSELSAYRLGRAR